MFDTLTDYLAAEAEKRITAELEREKIIASEGVAAFFNALRANPTPEGFRDAYVALHDTLRDLEYVGSKPLLYAWRIAESQRRADGLLNLRSPAGFQTWKIAEYVLDHADEPQTLSMLNEVVPNARSAYGGKLTGQGAAELVVDLANDNRGILAPARTKLDGRVAYLVRRSGDLPERDRWSRFDIPELVAS